MLSDLLESLLATAETWIPDAGRNYIAHGLPAMDCDSLVVWTESITATQANKSACSVVSRWRVHVSRFKCVPTMDENGNPFPAQIYEDSALDLASEGEAIWYGAVSAWADKSLFDGAISCTEIDLTNGLSVIEPQGSFGGWDLVIVVNLP